MLMAQSYTSHNAVTHNKHHITQSHTYDGGGKTLKSKTRKKRSELRGICAVRRKIVCVCKASSLRVSSGQTDLVTWH